jgi:hypothetical protein
LLRKGDLRVQFIGTKALGCDRENKKKGCLVLSSRDIQVGISKRGIYEAKRRQPSKPGDDPGLWAVIGPAQRLS